MMSVALHRLRAGSTTPGSAGLEAARAAVGQDLGGQVLLQGLTTGGKSRATTATTMSNSSLGSDLMLRDR